MGVDRTTYLVYGIKMPYSIMDEYKVWDNEDTYLPFIEGWEGTELSLIIDGMCGEYCMFGKVIAEAKEGIFSEVNIEDMKSWFKHIMDEFVRLFPYPYKHEANVKLYMFNHYS